MEIKKQSGMIVLVLLISLIFFGAASLKEYLSNSKEVCIKRPEFGKGAEEYLLYVKGEGELFAGAYTVSFEVDEMQPSDEELETYFSRIFECAFKSVIGNNKSSDCITGKLNFVDKVPGALAKISWELDDYSFFEFDGERKDVVVSEFGEEVKLTCNVTYSDIERSKTMSLKIMPQETDVEEETLKKINQKLSELEENKTSRHFVLPDRIGDVYLEWSMEERSNPLIFLLLGIFIAVMIPPAYRKEEEKRKEKRTLQMQLDYPYIVDKFLVLLTAGMAIRTAWERIAGDYEKQKEKGIIRPAYEELLHTRNELAAGVPERVAYEAFGKRCGLLSYVRFSTLISQNLRKGSRGILPMLELEAKNAFADRKQTARRLGEEAGTKLVFPMVGFLLIVMLIVIVPALQMI